MIKIIIGIDKYIDATASLPELIARLNTQQIISSKVRVAAEAGYNVGHEPDPMQQQDLIYYVEFETEEEAALFKLTCL